MQCKQLLQSELYQLLARPTVEYLRWGISMRIPPTSHLKRDHRQLPGIEVEFGDAGASVRFRPNGASKTMTIRELANILGLSKSTVAYALRGVPQVNAKTRELVQRRARELGYTPNPVASAFLHQVRSQGSETYHSNLAMLMPMGREQAYLASLREGAQERVAELGYGLDIIRIGEYTGARLTKLLQARGVLGVIAGPLPYPVGHVTLDWSKFAAVTYGYSMARPVTHRVVHHHAHGVRTVIRTCRRRGFRRIGLAMTKDADLRSNRHWSSGYLGEQLTLPESERVRPLIESAPALTPDRVLRWLREERPDLIILHTAVCVAKFRSLLEERPCVVLDRDPDDVLAGIDQQFKLSGRLLVDSLSWQIFHNERGLPRTPLVSMVEGLWIDDPPLPASGEHSNCAAVRRKAHPLSSK